MAHLVDTNVFLEILLGDSKAETCESFLAEHRGELYVSDFSINSIGVILNRIKRISLFDLFLRDILPHVHIARIPEFAYSSMVRTIQETGLDFDDAYQFTVAKEYNLSIATMDKDFLRMEKEMDILML